ncbi:hypothetical protein BPAE_0277g00010 [Botrytis paeoniae]|uniref:Uncharacterized protein n=1 Tax=Botrytis paeoniae TaxID=278948 RepID=A0A4Z1FAW8_9HELO|nr:hypothetical protein BPAE_0277g00010 [Botrytis paeoniae]
MATFDPIPYTYVPTVPRFNSATTQEQHIMPNQRSFDDTQRTNNGDDSGLELQANSDLRSKVWEGKRASPRIYDDDSSSIETVLDPHLYPGALIEGLQSGDNTQDTLVAGDDKSNSDKRENFSTDGSLSPYLDYSIEPSHSLTTSERDQSDFDYGDPEELENGSSPYFLLQQHRDIVVESMEGENNEQQGSRKRRRLSEADVGKDVEKDFESDDGPRPRKQQRTRSLPINNEQSFSQYTNTRNHLQPHRITSPLFPAQPILIDSPTPIPIEHSPRCSPSPAYTEPATAEYQEWPFKGFLKRTSVGNVTTYNLEFHL